MVAQVLILSLKHWTGSGIVLPFYLALLTLTVAAQLFRTWAAGYVGTVARGRETYAETLLTAGPYAHVRNPMYLGILVIITGQAMMSGLWYAPPIAWAAYAFVYSNVIPYEEGYLRQQFGDSYQAYCRAVPRLVPALHPYRERQGVFRLEEGLANEVASWLVLPVISVLFYLL